MNICVCIVLFSLLLTALAAAQENLPPEIRAELRRPDPIAQLEQREKQPPVTDPADIPKVIGGKDAEPGQFKWQVAIIHSWAVDPFRGFFCGGSLITPRHVLTAAHCVTLSGKDLPADRAQIFFGSHNFQDGERIKLKRITRHPKYDEDTKENDIAIIELASEPADKSKLALLELSRSGDEIIAQPRASATVLGWGSTTQGIVETRLREKAEKLQYVEGLRFQPVFACSEYHRKDAREWAAKALQKNGMQPEAIMDNLDRWFPAGKLLITENMFCAGLKDGSKDACSGDSGGPLVVFDNDKYTQVGIVSWGPRNACGMSNLYGVYVRLSRYLDWVAEQTR